MRWVRSHRHPGETPKLDAFLAEVAEVCRRHGLSLSHEDKHGAFEVSEYDDELEAWLLAAQDDRAKPEEPA